MAGLTREQRAEKKARLEAEAAAVPMDTADLATEAEDEAARIAVLERRLQNPYGIPAAPVRLKDKTMTPRWFSSALFADRFWQAQENGWRGVKPEDVVDLKQIGGFGRSPDGWLTRGERGQEVLMQMPTYFYDRLQLAKVKKNLELMRDTQGEQARALEAAGKTLGDEAATKMAGVSRKMTITDSYERVERTPGHELE